MRISDWSSDVCSSDLRCARGRPVSPVRNDPEPYSRPEGGCGRTLHLSHDVAGSRQLPWPYSDRPCPDRHARSEEHTSELQSLMRTSYAVFCLKKKKLILTHPTAPRSYKTY